MCHRDSLGTNAEESELAEWLREKGADEDTISRVKRKPPVGQAFLLLHNVECLPHTRHGA